MTTNHTVSIINAFPMPVMVIGEDERVQAVNKSVDSILGADLIGKHYITALRQPAIIAAIAETRRSGAAQVVRYTGRAGLKDTVYSVSVVQATRDVVLTFEDQTAAEEAAQMRRDFIANVSHELRTPLTTLLGFIETLSGAAKDDPVARTRFLEIMAHEANRMTRLVDDLMSLSRVEGSARVRPREQVALGAVLATVVKGLEPQARAADVTVTVDCVAGEQTVLGDAGQLGQVLTNLVENAIKYGASGKNITVTLKPPRMNRRLRCDAVEITVADNGDGIAAHHLTRLTERFYRVDNHRSREVGGTGLGLAIVKHIINRHRGRFVIESEEGKGTTVRVFLPTGALS